MEVSGHLHTPAVSPPGKNPGTHSRDDCVGPRGGLNVLQTGKTSCPYPDSFALLVFCLYTFSVLVSFSLRGLAPLSLLNNTQQNTSMPPAGFKPTIPASKQLQVHALARAVTGIGKIRTPDRRASSVVLFMN